MQLRICLAVGYSSHCSVWHLFTTLVLGDDVNWTLIEFKQKLKELANPNNQVGKYVQAPC